MFDLTLALVHVVLLNFKFLLLEVLLVSEFFLTLLLDQGLLTLHFKLNSLEFVSNSLLLIVLKFLEGVHFILDTSRTSFRLSGAIADLALIKAVPNVRSAMVWLCSVHGTFGLSARFSQERALIQNLLIAIRAQMTVLGE